jgi:hypothetical protein
MYQDYRDILVTVHSIGRWVLLLLLLVAILRSLTAGNRNFTSGDQKTGLFLTITADLMLVVGLILYFTGLFGYAQISEQGMGQAMKNSISRYWGVEHQVGMLIGIILIHIGKTQGKKDLPHRTKHKRTAIYYLLALLIIIASVPWPFREVGEGRGWF